ncbi:hypothetical protein [Bacteroides clarus]|uniref:hypothetical protein n=1 Tax=Bacteroides clarus TaxID=626929 RepID=UPI0018983CB9|nr:hypothetical protein [Bacteroides clarus]
MKRLLYVILLALAVCSCRTRMVYMPVETKVLDSIICHDTTFQEKLIPYKDSVSVSDTTSFLRNPYAYSYASWSNGTLNHSLGIYPHATVTVKIPYFIERIRRVEVPKPYPVEKELSWWEKFKINYGGVSISINITCVLFVIVWLTIKIRKKLTM